jgi:ribonucleoside-diphosphate reductase alpha chain
VYMRGWKSGCKGLTVYRDGCRSGVLVSERDDGKQKSTDGRPSQVILSHAPKRPTELPCEIHHAQIRGVRWTILIGILFDTPYEIFVGHSEDLSLPAKCDRGRIIKQRKGHYDLHIDVGDDELIIKNISKTFANPESAWATRVVSASLRHGIPCEFLVQTLSSTGNITDINRVIARLLKKFIKDGQKVRVSHVCESCGGDDLSYQEGCMTCNSCGSSRCG